jgi:hypothetical protein
MYYAGSVLKLGNIHMPDAGLLPFLCGLGLTVLSVIWFVMLRTKADVAGADRLELRYRLRPYLSLGLMVLYALALEALGYLSSTLLFVILWEQVIEREKWIKTLLIALLGTAAMYSLFRLFLKVPIPPEFFLR